MESRYQHAAPEAILGRLGCRRQQPPRPPGGSGRHRRDQDEAGLEIPVVGEAPGPLNSPKIGKRVIFQKATINKLYRKNWENYAFLLFSDFSLFLAIFCLFRKSPFFLFVGYLGAPELRPSQGISKFATISVFLYRFVPGAGNREN